MSTQGKVENVKKDRINNNNNTKWSKKRNNNNNMRTLPVVVRTEVKMSNSVQTDMPTYLPTYLRTNGSISRKSWVHMRRDQSPTIHPSIHWLTGCIVENTFPKSLTLSDWITTSTTTYHSHLTFCRSHRHASNNHHYLPMAAASVLHVLMYSYVHIR